MGLLMGADPHRIPPGHTLGSGCLIIATIALEAAGIVWIVDWCRASRRAVVRLLPLLLLALWGCGCSCRRAAACAVT